MTLLINAGGYQLTATASPIARPPHHYRLLLQSTLATARDPHDKQTVLDLILDAEAMHRLAAELAAATERTAA